MRPQQQNRRMRGRNNSGGGGNNNNNNNNRKGPSPLNRNYESNGPDVKIRGSAQQIAEKYATLARDAMSSGDRVMAENYLQHAEHYNRIIAAAQAQMPIQNFQQNREDFDDELDEERDEFESGPNAGEGQQPDNQGSGPQPVIEGTPAEVALNAESGRDNNGREGGNRDNNGNRHNRDRRHNNGFQNGQRGDRGPRGENGNRREEAQPQAAAPVETAPVVAAEEPAAMNVAEPAPQFESFNPAQLAAHAEARETETEAAAPRKTTRRPRKPKAETVEAAAADTAEAANADS